MKMNLGNWTRMAVVVVAIAGTQAGCKSGWKMPGSDMFPWSKKPSESTLAGSSPGLSMPTSTSTSPVGPSYKNTPSTLASNGVGQTKPPSPYGATGPSFNMPPNNPLASHTTPGMSGMPSGAGVSAGANGYTTGPYNMGGSAGRPGYSPQSGFAATPPAATPPSASSAGGYGTLPPQNAMANNMPAAYGGGLPAGLPQQNNNSAYAPVGSVPAMNASYNVGLNPSAPPQTSMPNALANSYPPSAVPSAPSQTYTGAAPYRPGSVGRQTSYDFSNQGAGSAGLPPAGYPATATGPGPQGVTYR